MGRSPRRSAATAGGDLDKKSPQAAKARPAVTTTSRQKSTHVGSRARSKVTANDLDSAVSAALTELNAGVDRDWTVAAHGLKWSRARTSGHIADDLGAYANAVGRVCADWLPALHLRTEAQYRAGRPTEPHRRDGRLLSTVVRAAPAGTRAYHPYGLADAEGFTALAVAEVLLHTHDIVSGLELTYQPPDADLCARVIDRLHPDLEPHDDPWTPDVVGHGTCRHPQPRSSTALAVAAWS